MKPRYVAIFIFIIVFVILVVLSFSYPGFSKYNTHFQADRVFEQGINCELNDDYICAKSKYQRAIEIYDRDSQYYFRLAQVQSRLGEDSAAIENYKRAKTLNPLNEDVLPELNKLIRRQATQAAATALAPTAATPEFIAPKIPTSIPSITPSPLPNAVYSIFDEEFGAIKSVALVSGSPEDKIQYNISEEEAYSGRKSLKITWTKYFDDNHWASLILGFDPEIDNRKKAEAGGLAVINLNPPSEYAIQFFMKGFTSNSNLSNSNLGDPRFTLKFQDQNLLFGESLGNQVVYIYIDPRSNSKTPQPDGRLLLTNDWEEICLPLANFSMDLWLRDKYKNFPDRDKQFDWSNVKQINLDADYFSTYGTVYIDAMRIIKASDCVPFPSNFPVNR